MSNRFTPGPWRINNKASMVVESPDRSIASCGGYANNTVDAEQLHEENKANARLIAAAPEMYELLKNSMHVINSYFPHLDGCTQDDEDLYLSASKQIESLLKRIEP